MAKDPKELIRRGGETEPFCKGRSFPSQRAYVLANTRAEGNASLMVAALTAQLRAERPLLGDDDSPSGLQTTAQGLPARPSRSLVHPPSDR